MHSNSASTTSQPTPDIHVPFLVVPSEIAIPVSIVDGISILFAGTANLVVMVMIAKYRTHALKNSDLLIFNLCLSDFVGSIFQQPLIIQRLLARGKQEASRLELLGMATLTCLLLGCAALFLLSLDRYLCVKFPFRYPAHMTKRKILKFILGTWIVSFGIGLLFPYYKNVKRFVGILYTMLLFFMFILTSFFQVLSGLIARRQEKKIHEVETSLRYNYAQELDAARIENNQQDTTVERANSESRSHSINHKKIRVFSSKTARTVTLLTLVYILSWLPQILLTLYLLASNDTHTFYKFIYVAIAYLQFHACVNPFIYVFRTRRIRRTIFHKGKSTTLHRSVQNATAIHEIQA